MLTEVACDQCGVVFKQAKKDQRFCHPPCRQRFYRRQRRAPEGGRHKVQSVCQYCGVSFWPKQAVHSTFCSRECGFAYKKARAKPPEQPIVREVSCRVCTRQFTTTISTKVVCSRECRLIEGRTKSHANYKPTPPRYFTCSVCSRPFTRQGRGSRGKYCGRRCQRKAMKKAQRLYFRTLERARKAKISAGEKIRPFDIFNRDGWKCQLCSKPVKRDAVAPHPLSPCIDHIVPLSKGGEHVVKNVQCAHFLCNSKRSNQGSAQMRLFG